MNYNASCREEIRGGRSPGEEADVCKPARCGWVKSLETGGGWVIKQRMLHLGMHCKAGTNLLLGITRRKSLWLSTFKKSRTRSPPSGASFSRYRPSNRCLIGLPVPLCLINRLLESEPSIETRTWFPDLVPCFLIFSIGKVRWRPLIRLPVATYTTVLIVLKPQSTLLILRSR